MKRKTISKVADEIMNKVAENMVDATYTDKRPPYFREKPVDKSVKPAQQRKNLASEELSDLWNSVADKVTKALTNKKRTNELLDFASKVKKVVVKHQLPDNVRSANWLDEVLKDLTNHDWIIPINVFRQDAKITIQAFKNDEMKK